MITMESCAASSQQITEMRHKLNDCASAQQVTAVTVQVQKLATAMTALFKLLPPNSQQGSTNQPQPTIQGGKSSSNNAESESDYGDKQNPKRPLTQVSTNDSQTSRELHQLRHVQDHVSEDEPQATTGNAASTKPTLRKRKLRDIPLLPRITKTLRKPVLNTPENALLTISRYDLKIHQNLNASHQQDRQNQVHNFT